jgi:hypothetical protein
MLGAVRAAAPFARFSRHRGDPAFSRRRQGLIEASILTNAALSAYSIQREFETNALTEIPAAYGIYLGSANQPRVDLDQAQNFPSRLETASSE